MVSKSCWAAQRAHDGAFVIVEPALGRIGNAQIKQRLAARAMTSKRLAQTIRSAAPGCPVGKHGSVVSITIFTQDQDQNPPPFGGTSGQATARRHGEKAKSKPDARCEIHNAQPFIFGLFEVRNLLNL